MKKSKFAIAQIIAMANPMAPANPAPRTACARGAAAPVKAGAACVIDERVFEVVTLRKTELETVTGETDVELALETMAGGTGVGEDLGGTGVDEGVKATGLGEDLETAGVGQEPEGFADEKTG